VPASRRQAAIVARSARRRDGVSYLTNSESFTIAGAARWPAVYRIKIG